MVFWDPDYRCPSPDNRGDFRDLEGAGKIGSRNSYSLLLWHRTKASMVQPDYLDDRRDLHVDSSRSNAHQTEIFNIAPCRQVSISTHIEIIWLRLQSFIVV